jgi:hypothetical protein
MKFRFSLGARQGAALKLDDDFQGVAVIALDIPGLVR